MSYVVLARKWRPMTFSDLVGQGHVSRTLGNAIASGRIAHAFLFTGVRGVGKTTSARILAKALNCLGSPDAPEALRGPTLTPCLVCDACREITEGTDVDVREIDGASYNGVDEVRKLQDSLPYRPNRDRYKIFIIDEVHMLSQNAWNAFLKTLEEPPPHVKFIFATTEAHKVPITILSRVQRFDFKLIRATEIAERLRYVLREEKIESDDAAVALLAREAAGSMRDAMSLLDQVIAASDGPLRGDDLAPILGVASSRVLVGLMRSVLDGRADPVLTSVADLAENGYDVTHVARDLLRTLRNVVVARVASEPGPLLDVTQEEADELSELGRGRDTDDLLRVHQAFSRAFDDVVRSRSPRAALEMALLRLVQRPPLLPLDDLLTRLGELERRLGGAPPPTAGRPASGSGGAGPSRAANKPTPVAQERPPEAKLELGHGRPPPGATAPTATAPTATAPTATAPTATAPTATAPTATAPTSAPPAVEARSPLPNGTLEQGSPPNDALKTWQAIVAHVRPGDPQLASLLNHGIVRIATPEELHVSFEQGTVFEDRAGNPIARERLLAAAERHFGARPVLRLSSHQHSAGITTLADIASRERETARTEALERAKQHPAVLTATEVLGAKVKDIRLPNE